MKIFRIEQFNAAHRLFNPDWDFETNNRVFGKCNNPNYHGHNYKLKVIVDGEIDPKTGFVMDMKVLSDIIKEVILNEFDHRNLNLDCSEFAQLNPTAENISVICWNLLRPFIPQEHKLTIELWETPRNGVVYDGK